MQSRPMWQQQRNGNLPDRRVSPSRRHATVPIHIQAVERGSQLRPASPRLRFNPGEAEEITYRRSVRAYADAGYAEMSPGVMFQAQEVAARRIAQRLHDESAQMLATVYLDLAAIARDCPEPTVRKIDQVVKHLDVVREQLRGLSHELSPPVLEQRGLMPALRSLADGVRQRSGLEVVVSGHLPGLSRLVENTLYRVVQEALSNVVRHADATAAEVTLSIEDDRVRCIVSDDGIGCERDKRGEIVPGLGLIGMRERVRALAGQLRIVPRFSGGTELKVAIPL